MHRERPISLYEASEALQTVSTQQELKDLYIQGANYFAVRNRLARMLSGECFIKLEHYLLAEPILQQWEEKRVMNTGEM